MRETTDMAEAGIDRFYLEDRERWEDLGFDWQGWNATIEKILQRQQAQDAAAAAKTPQAPDAGQAWLSLGGQDRKSSTHSWIA